MIVLWMGHGGHCWNYNLGTLSSLPSHCNKFANWVPVDFIYVYPVLKWIAVTCEDDRVPVEISNPIDNDHHITFLHIHNGDPVQKLHL